MTLEYCAKCGDATGQAGRADGSLYLGDLGPYCRDCYFLEAVGTNTCPECQQADSLIVIRALARRKAHIRCTNCNHILDAGD